MKVFMKPIKMISISEENGILTPLKFQISNEEKQYITIKIDNVCERNEEKLAGNRMLIYRCQSNIDGNLKVYELKYEISNCKWYLFKM